MFNTETNENSSRSRLNSSSSESEGDVSIEEEEIIEEMRQQRLPRINVSLRPAEESIENIMLARIHALSLTNLQSRSVLPDRYGNPTSPASHHFLSPVSNQVTALPSPIHPKPSQTIYKTVPQGQKLLCKIIRRKDPNDKNAICYELYLEEESDGTEEMDGSSKIFFMSARRKSETRRSASCYLMSTDPIDKVRAKDRETVACVRSNFIGTSFVVYDNGRSPRKPVDERSLRKELCAILYEPNILGFKGPRKMTVLLPSMNSVGERLDSQPNSGNETMLYKYEHKLDSHSYVVTYNKEPQWNEETESFVLDFLGRVTMASVKNFQLVHKQDS